MDEGSRLGDNVVRLHASTEIQVLPVMKNHQAAIYEALPFLRPSLQRDERNCDIDTALDQIRNGKVTLWMVRREDKLVGTFTTVSIKHPQRKTLNIEHLGGEDLRSWMNEALSTLKKLADYANCSAITCDGRLGFARFAQDNGFKEKYRHFEMEL